MNAENDLLLTQLTVRIEKCDISETLGTGIIYKNSLLDDSIYVLTAAHCLYEDGDRFTKPLTEIDVCFYNPQSHNYQTIRHQIDHSLVSPFVDADVAVLIFPLSDVEALTGKLTEVHAVRERHDVQLFTAKGFPSATLGRGLVRITPTWVQDFLMTNKFHLHLNQDFTTAESARPQVDGFSGSGIFLVDNNKLYLYGVFTRFQDAGKVIIAEYLSTINELLRRSFLSPIIFSFFGAHGLTPDFFNSLLVTTIDNLGPRFNEELNFRLPIAFNFNDLAKDNVFRQRLTKAVDSFLLAPNYALRENEMLDEIEKRQKDINDDVGAWFENIDWSADKDIDKSPLLQKFHEFEHALEEKRGELYTEQSKRIKDGKGVNKTYNYNPPLQSEINRIREIESINREFVYELDDVAVNLANTRCLIIKGEAGVGKSHLLGDVVKSRNGHGYPALLLLGQLFKKEQTVWQNILALLGLNCTKDEFLQTLNSIGKQTGARVLLMIDAINEGAGRDLWFDAMPGFISEVRQYPFIGLVFSIRTTYWNRVIPTQIQNDRSIVKITHEGFAGNEYKALQLFCAHYDITQPNFPILAPEYTNPLFLQLICQGIQASSDRKFPQGFQGLTKIFDYYTTAIGIRLEKKNSTYGLFPRIVKDILEKFASAAFAHDHGRSLSLNDAITLFDNAVPKFPNLLEHLIEESVIIRTLRSSDEQEIVYFAYERFGDNFIAEQLLKPYTTEIEIRQAFLKDQPLGQLPTGLYWASDGILEAMAIILPEKFNLEIIEVYKWVFEDEDEHIRYNLDDWLNQHMIESLKWRTIASINEEKINKWMTESGHFKMNEGNYLYFLVEMTAVIGHPFNSDRLSRILKRNPLPQRDSFWQRHVHGYHGFDNNGVAYPITRLIDWAWQDGISQLTDQETARLTGQTLCWLLASTNRGLRDQATKALVNLLQDQPKALLQLLDFFADIDDMYISERIYAVASACAVRSQGKQFLKDIALSVYSKVFADGIPQPHILLRDYARTTVEFALHCGMELAIDAKLIRPPYKSEWIKVFPTEKEIKALDADHPTQNPRESYGSSAHAIHHSVLYWDFSVKIMDSDLHKIDPVRVTFKEDLNEFVKQLPRGTKSFYKLVKELYPIYRTDENHRKRFFSTFSEDEGKDFWRKIDEHYLENEAKLKAMLDEKQLIFFNDEVIKYWELQELTKNRQSTHIETMPLKRWVVKRVFDMGYDTKLHGQFDNSRSDYDHRTEGRTERIGKKYQWIAYHELLARLTDHYKIRESYSGYGGSHPYHGPWDFYCRDIDPSFTTRINREKYTEDEFGIIKEKKQWWGLDRYDHWYRMPADWATSTADLPNLPKTIIKKDEKGIEWVYLQFSNTWQEPKPVGQSRYDGSRKEIWYGVKSYLVPKAKAENIRNWLTGKNFFGRWLPETHTEIDLLAREKYWSPYFKQHNGNFNGWETIRDSNHKVMLTTETAVGELSADKSGAHYYYDIPCRKMFEGMDMKYASFDGDFELESGDLVCTNRSPLGTLMRKDKLIEFLDKNNLEIIWVLLGEKKVYNKQDYTEDFRKALSGVYYFSEGNLTGGIVVNNW